MTPLLHLPDQQLHPLEDIGRLEAGDDTGNPPLRQGEIGVGPDDGAYVGRAKVAVDGQFRVTGEELHGAGDALMGGQDEVVGHPFGPGGQDAPGNGGGSGLETDPQENYPSTRVPGRQSHGVQGGVDDPDVGSPGPLFHEG